MQCLLSTIRNLGTSRSASLFTVDTHTYTHQRRRLNLHVIYKDEWKIRSSQNEKLSNHVIICTSDKNIVIQFRYIITHTQQKHSPAAKARRHCVCRRYMHVNKCLQTIIMFKSFWYFVKAPAAVTPRLAKVLKFYAKEPHFAFDRSCLGVDRLLPIYVLSHVASVRAYKKLHVSH